MINESPRCWCGSVDLAAFSPDYLVCGQCGTLVAGSRPEAELTRVDDEERDFYGRRYWFEYQERELGNPDITVRARQDLPERCLHWLRTILRYHRPPGRTLDLGCGHGALVMLLERAGFDATGLELSPWVVEFAKKTFGVSVLAGPLGAHALAPGSLDVITMMDVLEHLADPVTTLRAAVAALAEQGSLVIQTPAVPPEMSWDDMVAANHPFLPLMRERGHLYLFSAASVRRLLEHVGLRHVTFEPAHFAAYDMFVVARRHEIVLPDPSITAEALGVTPDGRLVQALLDLDDSRRDFQIRHADAELDRAARLAALQEHGTRLMGAESERNALRAEIENLKRCLVIAEADRTARLAIIREQGVRLAAAEKDRADRLMLIEELSEQVTSSEKDRAARLAVIEELGEQLTAIERDRAARLAVIEELSARLGAAEADRAARLAVIEELSAQLGTAEADRAARLAVIEEQGARVIALETARAAQRATIDEQAARLEALAAELRELRFPRARAFVRKIIRWTRA